MERPGTAVRAARSSRTAADGKILDGAGDDASGDDAKGGDAQANDGADDGATHCLIKNKCIAAGIKDPTTGSCATCQPAKDKYSYFPDAGYCGINGKCYKDGAANAGGCATCKVSTSMTKWTPNTAADCLLNFKCAKVCSGTCVDIKTSVLHCGKCGNKCSSGLVCVQGACILCSPGSKTFSYTGSAKTFKMPGGCVNATVEAKGAGGGTAYTTAVSGGAGGLLEGKITVAAGATLTVIVGGKGKKPTYNRCGGGGNNGGGGGSVTSTCNTVAAGGGGGGGANYYDSSKVTLIKDTKGGGAAKDKNGSVTIKW